MVSRWLHELKSGARYRFSCQMKAEDVKGCRNIKFGGYVRRANGKTVWPAASVGAGTFDWRTVAFDYTLPSGADFCLCYGIETGHGKVWFRDVKVRVEVAEATG